MEEKISRSLFISSADVISMQHVCAFARLVYFLGKAPSSLWGVGWRGGGGRGWGGYKYEYADLSRFGWEG